MKKYPVLLLLVLTSFACGPSEIKMEKPLNAKEQFAAFIAKEKFLADSFYPGLADEKMQGVLTEKINNVAADFESVAESDQPTNLKYHQKIKIGLSRFTDLYLVLDTEDRERVCSYIEELMDIVGLQSSEGQLNYFMYGFDPEAK